MKSVEEFLAYSMHLEQDAALRFDQLADAMEGCGNREVCKLFRQLANYSRMHLSDARVRSSYRTIPVMKPSEFAWPDLESPEAAAIWAADPFMSREKALEVALEAETGALGFYKSVLDTTTDPEIKVLAKEFVEEESGHVAELKKWIAAHKAKEPFPAV
jgi:rubrerythrin